MKKEVADAWIADLRTNPPQTNGVLFDGTGHCCLGRLCLILGATFPTREWDRNSYYPVLAGEELDAHVVLPEKIMMLAGMQSDCGHLKGGDRDRQELSNLNDHGFTFAQIADIIENNWQYL